MRSESNFRNVRSIVNEHNNSAFTVDATPTHVDRTNTQYFYSYYFKCLWEIKTANNDDKWWCWLWSPEKLWRNSTNLSRNLNNVDLVNAADSRKSREFTEKITYVNYRKFIYVILLNGCHRKVVIFREYRAVYSGGFNTKSIVFAVDFKRKV